MCSDLHQQMMPSALPYLDSDGQGPAQDDGRSLRQARNQARRADPVACCCPIGPVHAPVTSQDLGGGHRCRSALRRTLEPRSLPRCARAGRVASRLAEPARATVYPPTVHCSALQIFHRSRHKNRRSARALMRMRLRTTKPIQGTKRPDTSRSHWTDASTGARRSHFWRYCWGVS